MPLTRWEIYTPCLEYMEDVWIMDGCLDMDECFGCLDGGCFHVWMDGWMFGCFDDGWNKCLADGQMVD